MADSMGARKGLDFTRWFGNGHAPRPTIQLGRLGWSAVLYSVSPQTLVNGVVGEKKMGLASRHHLRSFFLNNLSPCLALL